MFENEAPWSDDQENDYENKEVEALRATKQLEDLRSFNKIKQELVVRHARIRALFFQDFLGRLYSMYDDIPQEITDGFRILLFEVAQNARRESAFLHNADIDVCAEEVQEIIVGMFEKFSKYHQDPVY